MWFIRPEKSDWYRAQCVNGELRAAAQLPRAECPECGEVWSSERILPFSCPPEIRGQVEALSEQVAIMPFEKFCHYETLWRHALPERNLIERLLPGDCFSPRLWSVPAAPRADLFWPGIHEMVVRASLSRCLQSHGVTGVSFRPIVLDRVGTIDPGDYAHVLAGSETIDEMFERIESAQDPSAFGTFDELCVHHFLNPSVGDAAPPAACATCATRDCIEHSVEFKKLRSYFRKTKRISKRHLCDANVFWSSIFFDGFIVSQKVWDILDGFCLQNTVASQLELVE